MSIEPTLLITTLIGGLVVLAIGILIGWLIARPATESSLRDTFRALSDEALKSNNQAFLDLAETRLREARTAAAADIEQRKVAIEHLLAPMAKTLGDVDREIREAELRRTEAGAQLLQRIASLDTAGQDLRAADRQARGRAQTAGRPRPLGRTAAEARGRARRHGPALRLRRAVHRH